MQSSHTHKIHLKKKKQVELGFKLRTVHLESQGEARRQDSKVAVRNPDLRQAWRHRPTTSATQEIEEEDPKLRPAWAT